MFGCITFVLIFVQCVFPVGACHPSDVLVNRTVVGLETAEPSASQSQATKVGEAQARNSQMATSSKLCSHEDELSELLDLLSS